MLTFTYVNNTKTQIDYVFIIKKWNNSALNCEEYFLFEGISSNHQLIMAKIRLCLQKKAARITTTVHYEWFLIYNRDIKDKYTLTLRKKFDSLQDLSEHSSPNDEYENFVNAHLEAAGECIPTKQRAKHGVPWETLAVIKKKKRADVKTAPNCKRRNPTYINEQNLKKVQNELTNIYLKRKQNAYKITSKEIKDSVEDRQSMIAWLTVYEASTRRSTVKAKLKVASFTQPKKKKKNISV